MLSPSEIARRLPPQAMAQLESMRQTGACDTHEMAPELTRFRLVIARARHTGGHATRWELTELGRQVLSAPR